MTIVYILNKSGEPLMPTKKLGKVKRLLKLGMAVAVNNNPFTIKLKYDTTNYTQELTLGIDPGRENIGLAVSDKNNNCLFQCTAKTDNKQIKKRMEDRKAFRSSRKRYKRIKKQRKAIKNNTAIQNGEDNILRFKKQCKSKTISYPGMNESITHKVIQGKEAKFNNRTRPEGWITPSARNLIQIHSGLVKKIQKILPITNIIIECNTFDFQKLENQNIKVWQYSKGPLYGFKDYKEYINFEQSGKCILCNNSIEHYHHIIHKSKGGSNTIKNFVGLCNSCHTKVHNDSDYEQELLKLKSGLKQQHKISLLNSCMHLIIEELNKLLPITITDGKITKNIRDNFSLNKTHCNDAYCISITKNPSVIGEFYNNFYNIKHFKKKSNNNIHKLNKREYYFNNKLIAINRHKAFNQKEDSLEEYMHKYAASHNQDECNKHFAALEIRPAKRTYTKHKNNIVSPIKAGDIIKYYKINKDGSIINKIMCAKYIKVRNNSRDTIVGDNNKEYNLNYCTLIKSSSLSFI